MISFDDLKQYEKDGYLVLKDFLSKNHCEALRSRVDCIVDQHNAEVNNKHVPHLFYDLEDDNRLHDKYFLESNDKVRIFLEREVDAKQLKTREDIEKNISKIGHALHALDPVYKQLTFSSKVENLFKSLNFKKPIVCQSSFIAKQPGKSGETKPHQDASFINVEPSKVAGVWIALQECNTQNGCLSFVKGSNKLPLRKKLIRNPNKQEFEEGKYLVYTEELQDQEENDFVPVPLETGSAILIDGNTIHKSGPNFSSNTRNVYAFNVYESDNAKYSDRNWMRYDMNVFLPLY